MGEIDFNYFYKRPFPAGEDWKQLGAWDLLISGFNDSERVRQAFSRIDAIVKHWLIFPEYKYSASEYPTNGIVFAPPYENEADYVGEYLVRIGLDPAQSRICIDITGFIRPHLMLLMRALKSKGVRRFDALYSEPKIYQRKEKTAFASSPVSCVRQVAGYEGAHNADASNDLLILGAGYDHELIGHVAESKSGARIVQIFGFPSLGADMYQESILRASRAAESVTGRDGGAVERFCSANDPFATASLLRETNRSFSATKPITNLYLSPLATKPQALGFALYYLADLDGASASIVFPFCSTYARETSVGLTRAWLYSVELSS